MSDDLQKYQDLLTTLKNLEMTKVRLEEQLKNKKEALTELVKKIQEAGYDPSKLKATVEEKKVALKTALEKFESDITAAKTKLSSIEV